MKFQSLILGANFFLLQALFGAQAHAQVTPINKYQVQKEYTYGPWKCTSHDLKTDPAPGKKKRCTLTYTYDPAAGAGQVWEGSAIFTNLKANVHYYDPKNTSKAADISVNVPLGPKCSTQDIGGDPAPGVKKQCQVDGLYNVGDQSGKDVEENGQFTLGFKAEISMFDPSATCPSAFHSAPYTPNPNGAIVSSQGQRICVYGFLASMTQNCPASEYAFFQQNFACVGHTANAMLLTGMNAIMPTLKTDSPSLRIGGETVSFSGNLTALGTWPKDVPATSWFEVDDETGKEVTHTSATAIAQVGPFSDSLNLKAKLTCGKRYGVKAMILHGSYGTAGDSKTFTYSCVTKPGAAATGVGAKAAGGALFSH